MVLFPQYLLSFGAIFYIEQLSMICRMDFDVCLGIFLSFDPTRPFWKGRSMRIACNSTFCLSR